MSNKTKIAFWVVLVVAVGAIAYLRMNNWGTSEYDAEKRYTSYYVDPVMSEVVLDYNQIKNDEGLSSDDRKKRFIKLIDSMPDKQRKYYYLAFGGVGKIKLHGKVVDQNNVPVSDAKVYYEGTGKFLSSGSGIGYSITDENGMFVINTKGNSLTLGAVVHPEVDLVNYPHPDNSYTQLQPRNSTMDLLLDGEVLRFDDARVYYTRKNPLTIEVWRFDKLEKVNRGSFYAKMKPDGRAYTINFNERSKKRMLREGTGGGDLYLTCKRNDDSWRIVLKSVAGGIQKTDDYYQNLAPEYGYNSSVVIGFTRKDRNFVKTLNNQRYFFTTNSAEHYGSLFVHYRPYRSDNVCEVVIDEYKVNMQGGRSLVNLNY